MAQDPLSVLVIEPGFPGRLGAVADWLVQHRGYRATFFCQQVQPNEFWPTSVGRGLDVIVYEVGGVAKESSVPWPQVLERGLCHAYGCWEVLENRRPRPVDIILGASDGLGSTLFTQATYPRVPVVQFFQGFLHAHRHDLADEATAETPPAYFHWRRASNAMDLLDLENGVHPWVPTSWQRDLYPAEYHDDFLVLHDGVNTRAFRPGQRDSSRKRVVAGRTIPAGVKLVTFVARSLDQLRGFDRAFELIHTLQAQRSDVLFVAVGDPLVSRSLDTHYHGQDYLKILLKRFPNVNSERFVCPGLISPTAVAELLGASNLHLYPSRVHAVSRSFVEAMASGCPILAAETEPVREFVECGTSARLVPGDSMADWLIQTEKLLDDPDASGQLGNAARERARSHFSRDRTLARLAETLTRLAGRDQTPNGRALPALEL